jgi:CMP-N,N'-diacetyllegionaminic acid synthase
MIVGVKETKANPYFVLFEENAEGYLIKSKQGNFSTRQDCPSVYEYNGALYLIDVQSLKKRPVSSFERIKKFVMDEKSSVDIDTELDWNFAEFIIEKNLV